MSVKATKSSQNGYSSFASVVFVLRGEIEINDPVSLRVPGPWARAHGPIGPKGQSAQRAHRPMAQGPSAHGPSAHGPGPIGPKGPLGSPGETPLGSQGTPPGIPRDPLKSLFLKNGFFKKISVKLHQWVFYRTCVYDNTIFDNDFSRILLF